MAGSGQDDTGASMQIGPTDAGMVCIYVLTDDGREIPLCFDPDEAREIAAAAEAAEALVRPARPNPRTR